MKNQTKNNLQLRIIFKPDTKSMPFIQRYNEILAKTPKFSSTKLWLRSIVFGVATFFIISLYLGYQDGYYIISTANRALAVTAFTLIGFSFMLSGVCYFWDFLDTKIIYRKYLGITGFAFGLAHGLMSAYFYALIWSEALGPTNFYYLWDVFGIKISNVVAFSFGLIGLLIFLMMTSISNRYAALELGGVWWRRLLRVGYLGYVFIIFHFTIKRADVWSSWISHPSGLPPISLWLLLLGLAVLGLRVALQIALVKKKRQTSLLATEHPTTPPQPITPEDPSKTPTNQNQ
ncbi:MAG: hypothetical protein A2826_00690 [Candidatus Doudnabacteria bacterium RIFCSPHIGHO2_01_FULL_43_23]|uniref:Ferric oxidoreductase domain-containing protein n=1 Tax=Candidatus Doudnabacteria bacterium RIFCSPHIGHO2_01_FULL_43_23 TaxID=1817822 RepID=A0A1F5NTS3_9BACT|nr:MAG: hypothetical protein A2826_00690 [Candidatus Doudnabacteria bacterium RIFCSPHIGHO2_01_FULL_43_23]